MSHRRFHSLIYQQIAYDTRWSRWLKPNIQLYRSNNHQIAIQNIFIHSLQTHWISILTKCSEQNEWYTTISSGLCAQQTTPPPVNTLGSLTFLSSPLRCSYTTTVTHFRPSPLFHATMITTSCMYAWYRCFYVVYVSIATNHSRIKTVFIFRPLNPSVSMHYQIYLFRSTQSTENELVTFFLRCRWRRRRRWWWFNVGTNDWWPFYCDPIILNAVHSSLRLTALLLQLSQLVFLLLFGLLFLTFFRSLSVDFLILCI